jgi:hypothetical protein
MKRRFITLLAAIVAFVMIGVVAALAVGVPEIDNANATFQTKPNNPVTTACAGEDATTYTKIAATWKGGEVDFTPGSTDYSLSGTLTLKGVWTINQSTGRGVFRAKAGLKTGTNVPIYNGTLTLITQNIVGTTTAQARGWLDAKTYGGDPPNPPANPDGGSVLANVEAQINTFNLSITGIFGDAPPQLGGLDYSVTTINQTC